jgi:quinol monooxygenase YgiN
MAQLTIIAYARARQDKLDALGERLLALVEPSRREPGCINYDVHQSNDDPAVWCVYENWCSPDDLTAHFETSHMVEFVNNAPVLVEGNINLQRLTMRSAQATRTE